jgi:uncharacterized membrane protein YjgN (DUF898 family)
MLGATLTLGLLTPFATARMAGLLMNNVWFGNRKLSFSGSPASLYKPFFICYGGLALIYAALIGDFVFPALFGHIEDEPLSPLLNFFFFALLFATPLATAIYQAAYFRWLCNNAVFGSMRLRSRLRGRDAFFLTLGNMLILGFTLGLGYAWTHIRTLRLTLSNVEYAGDPALALLLQDDKSAPKFGEGFLEALDVDIAL